jgi:hypothetical protein
VIEAGLFHLLSTNAPIAALCATRIYPDILPTGAKYPAIRYARISRIPKPTLTTSGMQFLRMQFDCHGESKADAEALAAAVESLLTGYQGLLSDGTFVQNVLFLGGPSGFEDDARTYCSISDYKFMYNLSS